MLEEIKPNSAQPNNQGEAEQLVQPDSLLLDVHDFLTRPGELRHTLAAKGALEFNPYTSGLFPASDLSPEMRNATGMGMAWLRDNAQVANALYQAGLKELAIPVGSAMLKILDNNRSILESVASSDAAHDSIKQRLPVRVQGDTLAKDTENRVQNDSVGYALWYISKLIVDGALHPSDNDLNNLALTVRYLEKIQYWHDADEGHWEEDKRIHASSIGTVIAGIREAKKMFGMLDYRCDIDFDQLISKGEGELTSILSQGLTDINPQALVSPYKGEEKLPDTVYADEKIHALLEDFSTQRREYDAALLFLIEPLDILHGEQADKVVYDVEQHLRRNIGIIRYPGDTYWEPRFPHIMSMEERTSGAEGRIEWRNQTAAGIALTETEAQWTVFDPILSTYFGKRFLTHGNPADRDKQLFYLNRSLAQLVVQPDGRLLLPEAFYLEYSGDSSGSLRGNNQWVPNDHIPLLWSQANLLNALMIFEASSKK